MDRQSINAERESAQVLTRNNVIKAVTVGELHPNHTMPQSSVIYEALH